MAFEVDDNEEMFEFGSCEEIEKLREGEWIKADHCGYFLS